MEGRNFTSQHDRFSFEMNGGSEQALKLPVFRQLMKYKIAPYIALRRPLPTKKLDTTHQCLPDMKGAEQLWQA